MGDPPVSDPDGLNAEISQLLSGEHHDPHRLLGPHEVDGATTVRALHPSAMAMMVLVADGGKIDMKPVHEGGLFSAVVPQAAGGYRLEAYDPTGGAVTFDDPYRFEPTLGEVDLHLLSEGKHRRLWDVLGAHPREIDGVAGTSFAVWAPNARSVRVVGEFNLWDGRLHPMRSLGSSGIWEIFLPGAGPEARYKFEILTGAGHLPSRPTRSPSLPRSPQPPTASSPSRPMSGATRTGWPGATTARGSTCLSRSTRSTWVRGGESRRRISGRSPTASLRSSCPPTWPSWAGMSTGDTIPVGGVGRHGFEQSAELTLPPLGVVWLCPEVAVVKPQP